MHKIERRHLARGLIEKYKLGESVDWLTAYTLDLEQEPSCERRKEAVEKLRALGNPKAIKVLEYAIAKRYAKRNACLIVDAKAGIATLTLAGRLGERGGRICGRGFRRSSG